MGQTILGPHPDRYASDAWQNRNNVRVCLEVNSEAVRQLYLDTLALAGQ
jgi:hypothetical protein